MTRHPFAPSLQRAAEILEQWSTENFRKTDRMFARLMLCQWLAGIAAALWIAPRTWTGGQSRLHPHVWAALVLGGLFTFFPVLLAWLRPGTALTRHVIGIGQVLTSALLIHLTGGRIETHFHVFASLVFLSFYRDWRVLLSASTVVALDHLLRGLYYPQSVYGVLTSETWRWLEHAGWVGFEDFFLFRSILRSNRESRDQAGRQAELEATNEIIEATVAERTAELRASEERVKASEEKYRLLFERNPHPMWLLDEGCSRFLAVNEAAVRHFGYTSAEFLRLAVSDLGLAVGPGEPAAEGVDGQPSRRGILERLPGTWPVRTRSGNVLDVEITRSTFHFGDQAAVLVLPRDITEALRAGEALRRSEAQLAEAQQIARIGSWEWDLDSDEVRWSDELFRIHGLEPGAAAVRREVHLAYVEPEDRDRLQQVRQQSLTSLQPFEIEYRLRRADGALRVVQTRGRVILDPAGRRQRMFGTCQDVTDRIEADERQRKTREELDLSQEQLRHAQKMEAIGRLAGGVAHDFNNLLSGILCYSHIILGRLDPRDPLRRSVKGIEEAAERAAGLTQQLLAFSRKQVLDTRVLDLAAVVSGLEGMLPRLIGEHIELVFRGQIDVGNVKADPGQLEQVIMNLAVNARDAMPSGGVLTIETGVIRLDESYADTHYEIPAGSYVVLTVTDTGCGMDAATRARVFEPFFTTKELGKGTGLGLSTVYGIIKQSGGHVWVYSEVGQGTTFKVYLPRVEEDVDDDDQAPARTAAGGTETILLVEDEPMLREIACDVLREKGYTVLEAPHGGEALLLCERHRGPIHLMLTDVVMPHMSGREVFERVSPLRPEMRVLYVSGYSDQAIDQGGTLRPGTAFLQKPFTPDILAARVREVLDGQIAREQPASRPAVAQMP